MTSSSWRRSKPVTSSFSRDFLRRSGRRRHAPSVAVLGSLPLGTCSLLGPLRDNGGPTGTHAVLSASPAIDGGQPRRGHQLRPAARLRRRQRASGLASAPRPRSTDREAATDQRCCRSRKRSRIVHGNPRGSHVHDEPTLSPRVPRHTVGILRRRALRIEHRTRCTRRDHALRDVVRRQWNRHAPGHSWRHRRNTIRRHG